MRQTGATPVQFDVADEVTAGRPDRLTETMRQADCVIYTAGASSAPTATARLVDTLSAGPGTGHVRLGLAIAYGDVTRADVAAVLAELAHRPTVRREILELTGGTTPILDAVTRIETMRTR